MNAYTKNILRTIIGNKRRSLLLLLITALGAAFFVGLRSTSPDMNYTFDRYFDRQNMYDIRVITNFGLTDKDILRLGMVSGVEKAAPAYSADLFAKRGDSSYLFRFHSMAPPGSDGGMIAEPLVIEGRMPEFSGECAVAHRFSRISGCSVGDTLTISTGDDTSLDDVISKEVYTITGLIESPLYPRVDFGSSSKGSGSIQSYAYIPFDDFNLDVYTEAQIFLHNPKGLSRFNDRYKDLSAAVEDELQITGDEIVSKRRRLTVERALREIADGTKKINGIRSMLAQKELELSEGERGLMQQEQEFARTKHSYNQIIASGLFKPDAIYDGLVQFIFAESELRAARDKLHDGRLAFESEKASAETRIDTYERGFTSARHMISIIPKAKCYVLGLDKNLGFASFEQDSKRIDTISYVFPLIFFLVSALVAFTSMVRIVEDDRPTVAAMQSLGYNTGAIARKYIIYALSVSIPGTILGIAVGYRLIPVTVFDFGYKIMYLMPSIETPLHMNLCILTLGVSLFSVILPTVLVTFTNMRESPAELMRPKAPLPGKRIALERVKPIWSAMNFSAKVTARNILRYKKRFIMTVAGIAGCTAIVLTGFGVHDSVKSVAANQFDKILYYAFQITLSDEAGRSDKSTLERYLNAQDEVTELQYQHRRNVDVCLDKDGRSYSSTLIVPDDASRLPAFVRFARPLSGRLIDMAEDSVVITQKLASLLGASPGDTLTLTDEDDKDVIFHVKVADVTENYVAHYIYMTPEHFVALTDSAPAFTTIVVNAAEISGIRRDEISEDILENESVSALTFNNKTRDFYSDTIDSLNVIVLVMLISGMLLAFVVLFCLTGINIDERNREIATLKVLGFYDGEAASHIFRENIVNTAAGVIIGLLLGILLHQYVMRTAEVDMILFEKFVAPLSYLLSVVLTFLYMFIVNTAMRGSIRGIDMIESLKSVE